MFFNSFGKNKNTFIYPFTCAQTVSVTVSILTLTFISIDRWYAIVFPLRYKPQPGRAIIYTGIIWTIGFLFDLPEFFVLHTKKKSLRFDIELFTQCVAWSAEEEKRFTIIKVIFLYTWVNFSPSLIFKLEKIPISTFFSHSFFYFYFLFNSLLIADFLSFSCLSLTVKLLGFFGDLKQSQDIIIRKHKN